jgi:hypothetical protein
MQRSRQIELEKRPRRNTRHDDGITSSLTDTSKPQQAPSQTQSSQTDSVPQNDGPDILTLITTLRLLKLVKPVSDDRRITSSSLSDAPLPAPPRRVHEDSSVVSSLCGRANDFPESRGSSISAASLLFRDDPAAPPSSAKRFNPDKLTTDFKNVDRFLAQESSAGCSHEGACLTSRCPCADDKAAYQAACACRPRCPRQFPPCAHSGPCGGGCLNIKFRRECSLWCECSDCVREQTSPEPHGPQVHDPVCQSALFAKEFIPQRTFLGCYEGETDLDGGTDSDDGDNHVSRFRISKVGAPRICLIVPNHPQLFLSAGKLAAPVFTTSTMRPKGGAKTLLSSTSKQTRRGRLRPFRPGTLKKLKSFLPITMRSLTQPLTSISDQPGSSRDKTWVFPPPPSVDKHGKTVMHRKLHVWMRSQDSMITESRGRIDSSRSVRLREGQRRRGFAQSTSLDCQSYKGMCREEAESALDVPSARASGSLEHLPRSLGDRVLEPQRYRRPRQREWSGGRGGTLQ